MNLFNGVLLLSGTLLGAILTAFGAILVEQYKSKQSFKDALRNTQVVKISEVWEALNIYEADIDNIIQKALPIKAKYFGDKEALENKLSEANIPNLLEENGDMYEEVKSRAIRNRFWLGEERYEEMIDYTDFLIGYMKAVFSAEDEERVKELDEKRQQNRKGINEIRDELLN